jgi:hypothetical protein
VLERATDADWATVCEDPCNGYVPAFGTYGVALRERQVWSAPFTLHGPPGTAGLLEVDEDRTVWGATFVHRLAFGARARASMPPEPAAPQRLDGDREERGRREPLRRSLCDKSREAVLWGFSSVV